LLKKSKIKSSLHLFNSLFGDASERCPFSQLAPVGSAHQGRQQKSFRGGQPKKTESSTIKRLPGGQRKKDRKIAKKDRKIALLSLYLLYLIYA